MLNNAILSIEFGAVTTEPVSLTEAKNWIKIADSYSDDNDIIEELITAAREILEQHLSLSIAEKEITVILKNELGMMELPYGPVQAVTAAEDDDGDALTEDEDYFLTGGDFKRLKYPIDYIQLTYNAGYTACPETLKKAIKMQVGYMYEHRGDELDTTGISPDAARIAEKYSRNGIFI